MLVRLWPIRVLLRTSNVAKISLIRTAPPCISQCDPGRRSWEMQPGSLMRVASSILAAGNLTSVASSAAIFSAQSSLPAVRPDDSRLKQPTGPVWVDQPRHRVLPAWLV
jgi:hypothetical protein